LQFVVFSAERLKGVDSIQENLNDAVLLQFAGTDNFGTKEQRKKSKGLIPSEVLRSRLAIAQV
jgi:hypothetical protein